MAQDTNFSKSSTPHPEQSSNVGRKGGGQTTTGGQANESGESSSSRSQEKDSLDSKEQRTNAKEDM